MSDLPKESIGYRVRDYPRLERELEETRRGRIAAEHEVRELLRQRAERDTQVAAHSATQRNLSATRIKLRAAEAAAEEARQALAAWGVFASKTGLSALDAEKVAEARQELERSQELRGVLRSQLTESLARIQTLEAALREGTNALASHGKSLSAIIDHMVEHECYCPDSDGLYRADAASADVIRAWVVKVAALQPTTDHEEEGT